MGSSRKIYNICKAFPAEWSIFNSKMIPGSAVFHGQEIEGNGRGWAFI